MVCVKKINGNPHCTFHELIIDNTCDLKELHQCHNITSQKERFRLKNVNTPKMFIWFTKRCRSRQYLFEQINNLKILFNHKLQV